jgi:acyl-CoA synthetase (NDP forming)
MAMDDRLFEAICRQAGILRLEEFNELFEIPKIFASQPLPNGNRLGVISYTGAIGVLAADEAARYSLTGTKLTSKTADMLDGIFPELGKVPVDIGPMSVVVKDLPALYPQIVNAVISDENVDALLNVLWVDPNGYVIAMYLEAYRKLKTGYPKPVATWIYGPNAHRVADLAESLEGLGFPVFSDLNTSIKALGLAYKYAQIKEDTTL